MPITGCGACRASESGLQVTHVLAMSPDLDPLIGSEVIEEGYFED